MKRKIIMFLCALFTCFFCCNIISYADNQTLSEEDTKTLIDEIREKGSVDETALDTFLDIYVKDTALYVGVTIEDATKKTQSLFGVADTSQDPNANSISLKNVYDALATFAKVLLVLFFIIKMIEISSDMKLTMEQIAKVSVQYMIGFVFIENGFRWLGLIYKEISNLSGILSMDSVAAGNYNNLPYTDPGFQSVIQEIHDNNFLANLMVVARYSSFNMIPLICMTITATIVWGIVIELGIRSCLSPVAFSEMAYSGFHGSGFRYFKRMIGYMFSFVAVILSAYVCDVLFAVIKTSGDISGITNCLVINILTVYCLTKATTYAHDLF